MPSAKRKVHAFVARLNPDLVRVIDAYAIQCNLSRNQAVEVLLEKCFRLADEVQGWREFHRQHQTDGSHAVLESSGEAFERIQFEGEQDLDYQRMVASRKLAKKRDLDLSAAEEDAPVSEKKRKAPRK